MIDKADTTIKGFYRAKVIDITDPLKYGRIKLEVHGLFDGIEAQYIPWAVPAHPVGRGAGVGHGNFSVPAIDSYVFVFFENEDVNQPVYFASAPDAVHGIPVSSATNYPSRQVVKTPSGVEVIIDDSDSSVTITTVGNVTLNVGGDLLSNVSGKADISTVSSANIVAGGDASITSSGGVSIVGGTVNLNPGGLGFIGSFTPFMGLGGWATSIVGTGFSSVVPMMGSSAFSLVSGLGTSVVGTALSGISTGVFNSVLGGMSTGVLGSLTSGVSQGILGSVMQSALTGGSLSLPSLGSLVKTIPMSHILSVPALSSLSGIYSAGLSDAVIGGMVQDLGQDNMGSLMQGLPGISTTDFISTLSDTGIATLKNNVSDTFLENVIHSEGLDFLDISPSGISIDSKSLITKGITSLPDEFNISTSVIGSSLGDIANGDMVSLDVINSGVKTKIGIDSSGISIDNGGVWNKVYNGAMDTNVAKNIDMTVNHTVQSAAKITSLSVDNIEVATDIPCVSETGSFTPQLEVAVQNTTTAYQKALITRLEVI